MVTGVQTCALPISFAVLDPITETHRINWVWMPPWGMEKITEDGREQLRAIGFNL